jgi:membrane fusion protein (multidrug efflux system)
MSESETNGASRSRSPSRRRLARRVLLPIGPVVVLLAGAYFYFFSGRYVSTDNAYVKADKVTVSAQLAGPIAAVEVAENQQVRKGQVLFRIDDAPFRLALGSARAELDRVRAETEGLKARFQEKQRELELALSDRKSAQREYQRQSDLAGKNVSSPARLDQAQHALDIADQRIQVVKQELAELKADLGGDPDSPAFQRPQVLAAQAARDQAALNLEHTRVPAPFDGVASKTPEVGQYVTPGSPVMSVVGDRHVWIEANFKETDLTHVHPGQAVTIDVDAYPKHQWHGTVQSISQATGSEFSVLPAQNATGNWVKVVQRIPVRIAVRQPDEAPRLRAGMSTEVEIDTQSGTPATPR